MKNSKFLFHVSLTTFVILLFFSFLILFDQDKAPLKLYTSFVIGDILAFYFFQSFFKEHLKEARLASGDRSGARTIIVFSFFVVNMILVAAVTFVELVLRNLGIVSPESWVFSIIFFAWLKQEISGLEE